MTAIYDPKAARVIAAGQATVAQAEADRVAAQTEAIRIDTELCALELQAKAAELAEAAAERKKARAKTERTERRDRRAATWDAIKRTLRIGADGVVQALPTLAGFIAIAAPTIIAAKGQIGAGERMGLGPLAVLVFLMLEGAAGVLAHRRHQAVKDGLPSGRLALGMWILALTAAAMQIWHAWPNLEIGVSFALASLVGFALIELLAGAQKQAQRGRTARDVQVGVLRAFRFPRLAFAAFSRRLALGPGADANAVWRQVWVDRYGVGPEATGRERKLGRKVIQVELKADRAAAANGDLILIGGILLRAPAPLTACVGRCAAEGGSPLREQCELTPRQAELLEKVKGEIAAGRLPEQPAVNQIMKLRDSAGSGYGVPTAQAVRDHLRIGADTARRVRDELR